MTRKRDKLKGLTKSWLGRTAGTGRMAASVGKAAVKRAISTGVDADLGTELVSQMDTMKGLAMKVGQMASYLEGTLPPEAQERLRALQRGSQPLDEWVENIPYDETRRYTRKVLGSYGIYHLLRTGELPALSSALPPAP